MTSIFKSKKNNLTVAIRAAAWTLPLGMMALVSGCGSSSDSSSTTTAGATFSSGTLIVSRTNYAGTAGLIKVGQLLPGGGNAVADGGFPEVFQNDTPDGSFGVASPIFLDVINTSTGSVSNSIAIDPTQMVSSFSSKSELALNETADGTGVTFMGYKSTVNQLDISNSNTEQAYDPTNPDTTAPTQRAVAQVNLNTGALTVTGTNGYSGNNGRAAVLVNGQYYMVGNAGNGSGDGDILSLLSQVTGVQTISATNPGNGNTTAVGTSAGTGAYGSATGYQLGFALSMVTNPAASPAANYADDKTGKDDNFRGLTVFNNTLYVSKGSGSNGVNTVYQVGQAGALANGGVLENATITILPGFNAISEKVAESKTAPIATPHPFGMFFANANTLFVADEGDGDLEGQTGKVTTYAGLQQWFYNSATSKWVLVATYQGGLNLNVNTSSKAIATITNGSGFSPANWYVYKDGLRNLTGKVNSDGSVTLYATTSTTSNDGTHDLGGDPNQVVTLTVPATAIPTTLPNSVNQFPASPAFTAVESAQAGQRLGGVLLVK